MIKVILVKKILYTWLVLVLLLTTIVAIHPLPTQASLETDYWNRYPIPQKGEASGWTLTSDVTSEITGVTAISVARDGTIYAATEEIAGSPLYGYNLFKSTDGGYSWKPLWRIPAGDGSARIIALALPQPEDASTLYLATEHNIYRSTDGGEHFAIVSGRPGGAGTGGLNITGFDVTEYENAYLVAVSIADISTTALTGNIDNVTNTIPVISTAGFQGIGIIRIENELISYTGTSPTAFTGCVRGYGGSIASSHSSGVAVVSLWNGEYGGAYYYDESKPFTPWTDLRVGGAAAGNMYDVLAVAFSPNFTDDEQIVAVVTDEVNTVVTTRLGSAEWGATIGDAVLPGIAATGGSLAFPADYDSDTTRDKYVQYAGINVSGVTGGVFMVMGDKTPNNSMAVPASAPAPVHSLAAKGNAVDPVILISEGYEPTIIGPIVVAGLTNGSVINITSGLVYTPPSAPPATNTCVALGSFHGSGYYVYAGTSGINGGFARSVDSGITFAMIAFICDDLTSIIDLAVSPTYGEDSTVFMVTRGNSGSKRLWRTTNRGQSWDAILTEGQQIATADGPVGDFNKVVLSSRFEIDTTIFICESGNGPDIWRSTDNGSRFWPLPQKATTAAIDSLIATGMKKVLVGDSLGNFYKTTSGGLTWSAAVATGLTGFSSMVLSPAYDDDETILASDNSGSIYLSRDNGKTWRPPDYPATSPGTGATYVAFDPDYAENGTFYAASTDGADLVVQRYTEDERWQSIATYGISGTTTSGATGLACSPDGTLYISDGTAAGVFRCLNPTKSPTDLVEWRNATKGIGAANLNALSLSSGSNVLLGYNGATVWFYEDSLTGRVTLNSPGDGVGTGRVNSVTLAWEALGAARGYDIKVNLSHDFKGTDYSPVDTSITSVRVTGLEDGLTYYWKVRVNDPILSRWSHTWSFTTALGAPQWNPFAGGIPEAPINGASDVSVTPSFAWNPADWATGYEFVLAKNSDFANAVISKTGDDALNNTVYLCELTLFHETTYYWKVRAISKTSASDWATAVFTTEAAAPTPIPPPTPAPTPEAAPLIDLLYLWVIIGIMGALVVILLVLIFKTGRP